MADEYIRRDFALAGTELYKFGEMEIEAVSAEHIQRIPAADVAEVAHARWERINSNWRCTRCNRGYRITFGAPMASSFAYCPNCGAKMDGGYENA